MVEHAKLQHRDGRHEHRQLLLPSRVRRVFQRLCLADRLAVDEDLHVRVGLEEAVVSQHRVVHWKGGVMIIRKGSVSGRYETHLEWPADVGPS